MMRVDAVLAQFADLDEVELTGWVARAWVRPERDGEALVFQEIDIARVRLVYDLRRGMAVPEDTMPLVLSLLDQLHCLHGAMVAVTEALADQPQPVRDAVRAALTRTDR